MARRKFNPSLFKYTGKRPENGPEGYIYRGDKPFTYKRVDTGAKVTIAPGQHVSSRQYQNLRYQGSGWKSKAQYETLQRYAYSKDASKKLKRAGFPHEASAWRIWSIEYALEHGQSIQSVRKPDSQFSQLYAGALDSGFDTEPNSPFAKLLAAIGWRDPDAQWQVGDTP